MAQIEWSDELSVGHQIIDQQHQVLIKAINLLAEGLEKNASKQIMGQIFDILTEYTATHFVYEEEQFERGGYPQTAEHIQEHEVLLYKVVEMKMKWEAGETEIGPAMLDFLTDWLKQHILVSDMKYRDYVAGAAA